MIRRPGRGWTFAGPALVVAALYLAAGALMPLMVV
jgi:hypothetical protein